MLTVTTSAGVLRYGQTLGMNGSVLLLASIGLFGILVSLKKKTCSPHAAFLRVAAGGLAVITLALTLVSCGGYTTSAHKPDRGTAVDHWFVRPQSRNNTHTTNVSVTVQ